VEEELQVQKKLLENKLKGEMLEDDAFANDNKELPCGESLVRGSFE
jgi:hypothetical protein